MDIYIPKSLMTAEYKNYSAEAKLLFSILLTNSATAASIMQVASLIENIGATKINTYHKESTRLKSNYFQHYE